MCRSQKALHQCKVERAHHDTQCEKHGADPERKYIVEVHGGKIEHGEEENGHPPCQQKENHAPQIVQVLGGQPPPQPLPCAEMIKLSVTLDGPRDFKRWSA